MKLLTSVIPFRGTVISVGEGHRLLLAQRHILLDLAIRGTHGIMADVCKLADAKPPVNPLAEILVLRRTLQIINACCSIMIYVYPLALAGRVV